LLILLNITDFFSYEIIAGKIYKSTLTIYK
jgi:hypothetical protein